MKRVPFFSAILLLAGWLLFQSIPISHNGLTTKPNRAIAAPCDSLPLECIPGIAVTLQPADTITSASSLLDIAQASIWSGDLLNSPDYACPGSYSVNRVGAPQNPDQDTLFLGCYDLGTQELEVWRYDTLGNTQGSCTTIVSVAEDQYICGADQLSIDGVITMPNGLPVPDVRLEFDWRTFTVDSTDNDGGYQLFEQAYYGEPVSIEPIREGDELNGVSTLDLVLISKHILGIEVFDSYTQYIAADINRSGSITLLDLIQLRRLILQQQGFDNNTSWRFVPTNPDHWGAGSVADWNSIPEEINLYDIESEGLPIYTVDFLAIKIGDLDGSAMP